MWCLVLMLLAPIPGFHDVTVLKKNMTEEACRVLRNHVGFEMAEAYPYDRDFVIACRLLHV